MPKAKSITKSVPVVTKAPGNNKRWTDEYPSTPRVERRIAQRIAGDTGSMDKPTTFPKG